MAETHDDGVKRILAKAQNRKKAFNDIKDYCTIDDLMTLLDAGAKPAYLNAHQPEGSRYTHLVCYEGHLFASTSDTPVAAFTTYLARRN